MGILQILRVVHHDEAIAVGVAVGLRFRCLGRGMAKE